MTPVDYRDTVHVRKHYPRGYQDIESYRPWLRDEFSFQCVYCLRREKWFGKFGFFEIDHYQPQSIHPELTFEYRNLIYSCRICNLSKLDIEIPDPTAHLLNQNLKINEDGSILGLTTESQVIIDVLQLNSQEAIQMRLLFMQLYELSIADQNSFFRYYFTLPDDLPDLKSLRPPLGNDLPSGVEESYFERRRRGEL